MRESVFQAQLIKDLIELFPGAIVLKNDSSYLQGVPDLIVLYRNMWAALEVKAGPTARLQPNQVYWIDIMDNMSFAAIIDPENREEILRELQQTFRHARNARVSKPQ